MASKLEAIMRFQIYYFTGTGNTWWVVNQFAQIAREAGHTIELTSIEQDQARDLEHQSRQLKNADFFIFAYPIYGSTAPNFFKAYVNWLKFNVDNGSLDSNVFEGKKCGVLTSMAFFSGDGALVFRKLFEKLGMKQDLALNIALASNISIPWFRYNPVPEKKLNKRKIKGRKKIKKAFKKIEEGGRYIKGRCPIGKFLGWLQRTTAQFEKLAQSIDYNQEKCTNCGFCYKHCPTDNISVKNEVLHFKDNCTLCTRCYNFCPTYAIRFLGKHADPEKYLRYKGPKDGFSFEKV